MTSGGFLDPKARGMNLGYDQAVALPAMQADGKSGQEDIFKETNKVGVGLMQGYFSGIFWIFMGNNQGFMRENVGFLIFGMVTVYDARYRINRI